MVAFLIYLLAQKSRFSSVPFQKKSFSDKMTLGDYDKRNGPGPFLESDYIKKDHNISIPNGLGNHIKLF